MNLNQSIIYMVILSFIGYIYETFAMTLWAGKFDNRGFLLGPIIPIYGIGAYVGTVFFDKCLPDANPLTIFIVGIIASAILEYPTSYIMEKAFNQRWWDYTNAPFNIEGRVSLFTSMGFGLAAIIIVRGFNPVIIPKICAMPADSCNALAIILTAITAADFSTTIAIVSDFEDRLSNMEDRADSKIGSFLSYVLDEEDPLRMKFYGAVEKVEGVNKKIKKVPKKVKQTVDKGATTVKDHANTFYIQTIKRVSRFRAYRLHIGKKNKDE